MALAAFLLLDLLTASLFTDALVQFPKLARDRAGSAAGAGVLAGTAAAVLLMAIGPLVAAASNAPEITVLTWAFRTLLPVSAWSGAMSGLALRRRRFFLLAARVLLGQRIALSVALLAAAEGFGPGR